MITGIPNLERTPGSPIPENSSIWGVWTAPAERITSLEHETLWKARLPSVKNFQSLETPSRREILIPQLHWPTSLPNNSSNVHYVVHLSGLGWHVGVLLNEGSGVYWSLCRNNLALRKIWSGCRDLWNQVSTCLQLRSHCLDQSGLGFPIPADHPERALKNG